MTRDTIYQQTRDTIYQQTRDTIYQQTRDTIYQQTRDTIYQQTRDTIYQQTRDTIYQQTRDTIYQQTRDTIYQFRLLPFGLSPAPWVFAKIMTDQNAGTRDGHQSLSVPWRLAHLFTISRPVTPRYCTSAQSLPHDGPPHSQQEVGTDPNKEIPFSGIPVRPGFLPGHSNSGSISQNQSTDLLIPAKPRRMCSYMADPARFLCVHRENGSSRTAAHLRSPKF